MKVDSQNSTRISTELRGQPLRLGQVLAAIVLKSSNSTGEALLSLAGGQLTVQTRLPLQPGTALKLTVSNLGPPVILQPVADGSTPPGTKPGQDIQTRLLALLFQRTSQPTPGSSTASSTATNSLSGTKPGANPFSQTDILTGAPASQTPMTRSATLTSESISLKTTDLALGALPAAVRTALPQIDVPPIPAIMAGTLAKLVTAYSLPIANERTTPRDTTTNDLKTQLKLAAQAIKSGATMQATPTMDAPTTPAQTTQSQVLSALSNWLNNMDISQLRTALQQVQGQANWIVDVPVVIAEHPRRLQLAVTQEDDTPTENGGGGAGWQLDFALDLPSLGPLHGSLNLKSTDLTVRLYADEPDSRQQLNRSLDRLAGRLRQANLNPLELTVYPGPPPTAVQARLSPEPKRPDGPSQHSWRV